MADFNGVEGEPVRGREPVGAVAGWLEDVLRGTRGQLEENARAWVSDLKAANEALRHGIDTHRSESLSEALDRLERLEAALRLAPGQIVEHVGRHTARLTSAGIAQLRRIDQLEAAERELESANTRLHEEISERGRLAQLAGEAERGLREVRERFESAFDNAPIGMALIAMDGRWLQVNGAMCRITGHTEDELKATTLRAMTHPEDVDLDAGSLRELLAGHIPSYQVEKRFRHAWGHRRLGAGDHIDRARRGSEAPVRGHAGAGHLRTEGARPASRVLRGSRLPDRSVQPPAIRAGARARRSTGRPATAPPERSCSSISTTSRTSTTPSATAPATTCSRAWRGSSGSACVSRTSWRGSVETNSPSCFRRPTPTARRAWRTSWSRRSAARRPCSPIARSRVTASVGVTLFDGLTDIEVLAYADLAMYEAKEAGPESLRDVPAGGG